MSSQPSDAVKKGAKLTPDLQRDLLRAIHNNDIKGVDDCLKQGVHPDFISDDQQYLGWSPLTLACRMHAPEIVVLLLKAKANPNLVDAKGFAPLHRAIIRSDMDSIFKEAFGPDGKFDYDRCTKLFNTNVHLENDRRIVKELLQAGADINQPTQDKKTPVCMAGQYTRLDLVLELFNQKADTTIPKGIPLRSLYVLGFGILKRQLKKNPKLTIKDIMVYVKKYDYLVSKILSGEGDPDKDITKLEQAVEKDDKALQNYIRALQQVVTEYLSKKATFLPGKAKLAGVQVFLEKLKLLENIEEAQALELPFCEVFPDAKLGKAAEEMLLNLPKFKGQKTLQNCTITLDDLLSANRQANKKEEPESLKRFNKILRELNDATEEDNSAEQLQSKK
jgi:tetratricopeptide (TPR) repeat protein